MPYARPVAVNARKELTVGNVLYYFGAGEVFLYKYPQNADKCSS